VALKVRQTFFCYLPTEENVVSRSVDVQANAVSAFREQFLGLTRQSERTLLLGTVLLASVLSATTLFVLTRYFGNDVISSLFGSPRDCRDVDLGTTAHIGQHCFSDYSSLAAVTMQPNPWYNADPSHSDDNVYPAAAMVPALIFGLFGRWLGAPRLGLLAYLFALTIAVLSAAFWAARRARGIERVVVFVACGAAAIPAWFAVDRGNSVGFVVPAALVFLVELCRRRWGLVTIMVVLLALLKPPLAVLGVALFAARQWRWGGIAVAGAVICNLAAFLLWPRDFPGTITQSLHNTLGYAASIPGWRNSSFWQVSPLNVSFGKGLLMIPVAIKAHETGGVMSSGFLAGPRSLIGYGVLVLVVVSVLALGRRIPPVMVGIALLATASLFAPIVPAYYLIFALPVAALVARDPDGPSGSGIFDRLGDRRRAVGICVSVAAALSIAQIALPHPVSVTAVEGQPGDLWVRPNPHVVQVEVALPGWVETTRSLAPLLWLAACAAIIVSYARRPAPEARGGASTAADSAEPAPATAS
jgi:Glycosyltransferase family 87